MTAAADHFVTAQDGLRLHVREYGERTARALPVVCLPGLARTTADFDPLAAALARDSDHPRRVLALDYRGRGLSDHDADPSRYSIPVELGDLVTVLTARAVESAVFVGTSRGGLIAMALATVRPTAIAGVVLNDIGPVIEPQGLMRIKSYVGKLPQPATFAEGAETLRRLFGPQFPRLGETDWLASAHRTWRERDGGLALAYDPRLAEGLGALPLDQPLPALWPQFDALANVPMMVIRGANSDILSAATLAAMQARRRATTVLEIPDQGHAPLLAEADTIARIADFIAACDKAQRAERAI
ncbi:MAG TPA: alpha/beta hydrolase [Xanthobacteraceae bacterium]|jgi:pimeloyl-ACP methyl ester carboxylesterase